MIDTLGVAYLAAILFALLFVAVLAIGATLSERRRGREFDRRYHELVRHYTRGQ